MWWKVSQFKEGCQKILFRHFADDLYFFIKLLSPKLHFYQPFWLRKLSQLIQWWLRPQAALTPSNWSALYRGRGSPVMSWILLKANNGQQASGVGDKRFFRFKRNAYHLWTAILQQRLNDITHQQVMRFNQGPKFANIFKVHIKHPQCFGTLAQSSHFLWNSPVITQWVFTGPARVEWLWINDFGPNEYHIWHGWPNTCWHVGNKSPKYEVPIFTAQTRNHWRKSKGCASVPKNELSNWCD